MLENVEVLCHSSIKINKEKVIYIDPFKIDKTSFKFPFIKSSLANGSPDAYFLNNSVISSLLSTLIFEVSTPDISTLYFAI